VIFKRTTELFQDSFRNCSYDAAMEIINPGHRRLVLIIIVATILIVSCRWLLPQVMWASELQPTQLQPIMTKNVVLNPVTSYFASPATNQGHRRFLAIGNFYDTTNSAYFYNAKTFLNFELPDLRIASAKLILYKYAHGGTTTSQLSLYKGNKVLANTTAAVGNYDYTPLEFNIEKQHLQPGINLALEIIETSSRARAGIAACSGTILDEVCPEQYRPRLVLTYLTNKLGQMELHSTTSLRKLGIKSRDDFVSCQESLGCLLRVAYKYNDLDSNSRFRLEAGSLVSGWQSFAEGDLSLTLPNGEHNLKIVADDGGEQVSIDLGSFDIGVSRPNPPEILYQDEFSSRSGIKFILADNESIKTYQLEMCGAMTSSEVLDKHDCEQRLFKQESASSQIELIFTEPYESQQKYFYRFTGNDDYGNTSDGAWVSAVHNPELKTIAGGTLNQRKISPQNRDGKFDSVFVSSSGQPGLKLRVYNYKLTKIFEQESLSFSGRDALGKLLANGKYYLQLWGNDPDGYPYIPSQIHQIEIDNTPPRLW
jgi:hypothetical protein